MLYSSIFKRVCRETGRASARTVPCPMLCAVSKGNGLLRVDGEVYPLKASQSYFLLPGMKVEAIAEADIEYYAVLMEMAVISKRGGKWSGWPSREAGSFLSPGKIFLGLDLQLLEKVKAFYRDARAAEPGRFHPGLDAAFQSLLHFALREEHPSADIGNAGSGINQSIRFMHRNFREKIKLDDLSKIAGLTPTSYSRSFKKMKGVAPSEYLNRIRMDVSKQLLSQSESRIQEVSARVGFSSEFHFSRMFKRTVGITPTMYMKRKHIRIAVVSCLGYPAHLQSLGIEPVAAVNCEDVGPGQSEYVAACVDEIKRARPDLIIGDYRHLPYRERMQEVAPTVMLDFGTDWRANHMKIAELAGREADGRRNLDHLEESVNYARQELARTMGNETVLMMRWMRHAIRVQGAVRHPLNELLYDELGLKPCICVPLNKQNSEFAADFLPPYETDHLFVLTPRRAVEEDERWLKMRQSASWSEIRAVRNRRIRWAPNWVGMSWAPIGRHAIIDQLLKWNKADPGRNA